MGNCINLFNFFSLYVNILTLEYPIALEQNNDKKGDRHHCSETHMNMISDFILNVITLKNSTHSIHYYICKTFKHYTVKDASKFITINQKSQVHKVDITNSI